MSKNGQSEQIIQRENQSDCALIGNLKEDLLKRKKVADPTWEIYKNVPGNT